MKVLSKYDLLWVGGILDPLNELIFQLNEIEAEELEAGIKNMEMKRQISYQTIAKMAKKVKRNFLTRGANTKLQVPTRQDKIPSGKFALLFIYLKENIK